QELGGASSAPTPCSPCASPVSTATGTPIGASAAKIARPQIKTAPPYHKNPQHDCITLDRTRRTLRGAFLWVDTKRGRKRLKNKGPDAKSALKAAAHQNGWYWKSQVSVRVWSPDFMKARSSTGSVPSTARSNWARQWPRTPSGTASISR